MPDEAKTRKCLVVLAAMATLLRDAQARPFSLRIRTGTTRHGGAAQLFQQSVEVFQGRALLSLGRQERRQTAYALIVKEQMQSRRGLRAWRASLLATVASLVGCSTPVFEGGRAWNEGWREGKVEKVAFASELGHRHSYDCRYRDDVGTGSTGDRRFAVVGLHDVGRHRHHVVPVGLTEPPIGASVLTNLRDCGPPIVVLRRASE